MLNKIVCRYGVPSSLHSDQGANLCSGVIQSLCQLLGISTTGTSAYHVILKEMAKWKGLTVHWKQS